MGEENHSGRTVTKPELEEAEKKHESSKTESKPEARIPANSFVNTLGMPFVPVSCCRPSAVVARLVVAADSSAFGVC